LCFFSFCTHCKEFLAPMVINIRTTTLFLVKQPKQNFSTSFMLVSYTKLCGAA